ncbi:MAG: hypothetical protein ACOCU4_01645 [Alkalispirochaeta sp.]
MKRRDGATIEWRALWETMVIPVPSRRLLHRRVERETIRRCYPFDLTGCRIDRAGAIGAVLVTPPGLSGAAADRPVPALAIARSTRARRLLAPGDATYRFGTPRGYDYYHFRRRRLVACWSTIGDEPGGAPAPTPSFSPRELSAARGGHRKSEPHRARIATAVLALAAVGVQAIPDTFGQSEPSAGIAPGHLNNTVASSTSPPEGWSPFPVLRAAGRRLPDLQIRSFSAGRDHYRWELHTSEPRVSPLLLAETYPEIEVSVQHRDNHTTVSLEGTR